MRRGADSGRAHAPRGAHRRLAAAVALVAVVAVVTASLAHVIHEHPHRVEQELSCAVCQTPIGEAAVAPTLTPPAVRPEAPPAVAPPAPPAARPPLSFSPKQSPPPSA